MDIISNRIEQLRGCTDTSLSNVQGAYAPAYYKMRTEVRYNLTNELIYYNQDPNTLLLLALDIPFSVNQLDFVYRDYLANLVAKGEVYPFLLFLNGRFIPWSKIEIIKASKYSYMLVHDYSEVNPTVSCIQLPMEITYEEFAPMINPNSIFTFNKYGEMVTKPNQLQPDDYPYVNISMIRPDVLFERGPMQTTRQQIKMVPNNKIGKRNIMVFKDGLLISNMDNINLLGFNIFSVNSITLPSQNIIEYTAFYYEGNPDSSLDNLYQIPLLNNGMGRAYAEQQILATGNIPKWLVEMNIPYDFQFSNKLTYKQNIANILNSTMNYRANIMSPALLENSQLRMLTYTGAEINKRVNSKGYVSFSLKYKDSFNNDMIIFVNGLLYKNYYTCYKSGSSINVYWSGVQDTDEVEIWLFTGINNNETEIVFESDSDNVVEFDNTFSLSNDNLQCFSYLHNPDTIQFNSFGQNLAPKEIEITSKLVSTGSDGIDKWKIYPNDPFYYDMVSPKCKLCFKNQFKYYCKWIDEPIEPNRPYNISVELLNTNFELCNNPNQFLVFVNGRRLGEEQYELVLPEFESAFNEKAIYINYPVQEGGKIEIFYVPMPVTDIASISQLDLSGDIIIPKSQLKYALDSSLYLFFANGRKIPVSQIQDISPTHVRLNTTIPNITDIQVTMYTPENEILYNLFKETNSSFSEIINSLSDTTINNLFGNTVQNNITEPSMSDNMGSKSSLLNAIMRDYYIKPYASDGEAFAINTDSILVNGDFPAITETDQAGDLVFRSFDANQGDTLGGV